MDREGHVDYLKGGGRDGVQGETRRGQASVDGLTRGEWQGDMRVLNWREEVVQCFPSWLVQQMMSSIDDPPILFSPGHYCSAARGRCLYGAVMLHPVSQSSFQFGGSKVFQICLSVLLKGYARILSAGQGHVENIDGQAIALKPALPVRRRPSDASFIGCAVVGSPDKRREKGDTS